MINQFKKMLKENNVKKNEYLNDLTFMSLYTRYKLKAMNIFQWKNLPNTIESKFIEEQLFEHGTCGIAYDENRGLLALQVNSYNYLDINNKPSVATLHGNAYHIQRNVYWGEDTLKTRILGHEEGVLNKHNSCVIIRNNDLAIPTFELIAPRLYTLYNASRKLDVALDLLPLNNILVGSTKDKFNLSKVMENAGNNIPVNLLEKELLKDSNIENLNLNVNTPYIDLYNLIKAIEGSILEQLGVNAVTFEKKERLISDEVNKSKESVENEIILQYKNRVFFKDLINELFGTNIEVEMLIQDGKEDDLKRNFIAFDSLYPIAKKKV